MKPEVITRQNRAVGVARRWAEQYEGWNKPDKIEIGRQLAALTDPTPDVIDAIIGNKSWTETPKCDGCGKRDLPAVVQVGEWSDYESNTASLCVDCVREALAAIERA